MDTDKRAFIRENKHKSGVYLIKNNENGRCYVGSSINISGRFYMYYSLYHITNRKDSTICKALLKYGYSKFSLEILEYCDPSILIEREQYYLDVLKPQYNVLKVAGSSKGRKQTESAKLKISKSKTGVKPKPETLKSLREHLSILNKSKAFKVEVNNVITKETIVYDSLPLAAASLGCSTPTIINYDKRISQGKNALFKGIYRIKIIRHK